MLATTSWRLARLWPLPALIPEVSAQGRRMVSVRGSPGPFISAPSSLVRAASLTHTILDMSAYSTTLQHAVGTRHVDHPLLSLMLVSSIGFRPWLVVATHPVVRKEKAVQDLGTPRSLPPPSQGWARGKSSRAAQSSAEQNLPAGGATRRHRANLGSHSILTAEHTRSVLLRSACPVFCMTVRPSLASVRLRSSGYHLSINIREPTRAGPWCRPIPGFPVPPSSTQ